MQYLALTSHCKPILATQALRQTDYLCPECRLPVRLRQGPSRQPHFYHLRPNPHCQQSGKSLTHLALQHHIQSQLPSSRLEVPFPAIGRIADLLYQELVFEIQCSPMTRQEAHARILDYRSLGLEVIWILHDSRYNQYRLTPFEDLLSHHPHYFTNMDQNGKGIIYDQWSENEGGRRIKRSPKLVVSLEKIYRKEGKVGFEGDYNSLEVKAKVSTKENLFRRGVRELIACFLE